MGTEAQTLPAISKAVHLLLTEGYPQEKIDALLERNAPFLKSGICTDYYRWLKNRLNPRPGGFEPERRPYLVGNILEGVAQGASPETLAALNTGVAQAERARPPPERQ